MILSYLRGVLASTSQQQEVQPLSYADGFKHGFDAGQTSCVGNISVAELAKECIDRGDIEFAIKLLKELRSRE